MMHPYWGMGWGMWFIPLLIILVIYFMMKNNSQTKSQPHSETPMEILKKDMPKGKSPKDNLKK